MSIECRHIKTDGETLATRAAFSNAYDAPLGTKRVQANIAGEMDEYCTKSGSPRTGPRPWGDTSLPFGNDINNPYTPSCIQTPNPLNTQDDATEHHLTQKERDNESGNYCLVQRERQRYRIGQRSRCPGDSDFIGLRRRTTAARSNAARPSSATGAQAHRNASEQYKQSDPASLEAQQPA